MKIYGIKTCGSVKKAFKYFKENNIEYDFTDFKKDAPNCDKIEEWLKNTKMDILFNKRGRKYRELKLKELNLNENDMKSWLCKEFLLIKRPVIEFNNKLVVGFNEEEYNKIWGK